jgi:hypothetical protein
MSSGSSQERLPFEPRQKKKKAKPQNSSTEAKNSSPQKTENPQSKNSSPIERKNPPVENQKIKEQKTENPKLEKSQKKKKDPSASLSAIPEEVSKRMIKRMAIFSGIPTFLGFLSFIGFYFVVSKGGVEIPTVAVLIVSIIFFGSGFLGLSYGIFSTSWDEKQIGSVGGWEEFKLNFGRTVSAWRESRKEAKNK